MFKKLAIKIRHHSLLEKHEWLWKILRKPYYFVINPINKGVGLQITENFKVRMPSEYYNPNIMNYEVKSVEKLLEWVNKNPDNYILDIGCSIGYMSLFALFASDKSKIFAFDSDDASLAATKKICQYASSDRLKLVYGFIADENTSESTISEAIALTDKRLSNTNITGNPGTTKYINLDSKNTTDIPVYSIDNLFTNFNPHNSSLLIKCDVEGAELFVLKGAKDFLHKYKPQILLSVHPQIISIYNHTTLQIWDILSELGYIIDVIEIDHEEHWWCSNTY